MNQKQQFMKEVFELVDKFVDLMDKSPEVYASFFNNGFESGGADEITYSDIEDYYDVQPAEIAGFLNFVNQYNLLLSGGATTQLEWSQDVNKIRYGRRV